MFFANPPLLWTIICLFVALLAGTLVRIVALRGSDDELASTRIRSLKTWWGLAVVLALAVLMGQAGILLLLAVAGILGLGEYTRLVGWKEVGRPTLVAVFGCLSLFYGLLWFGDAERVRSAAPVAFLLILGAVRAWLGLIDRYIRTTAAMFWGLMLFVFCLAHAYFVLLLPFTDQPPIGKMGWFLFLVILTESNDIAQAIIGRRCGKTKITPRISPHKSLEGLVGGMVVTMLLAVLLAPWMTTWMQPHDGLAGILSAFLSGMLISISGFLGDINMSGIKRDAGVKDGSALLPGQGGMIDRIDSLTFTAPTFYYFVQAIL